MIRQVLSTVYVSSLLTLSFLAFLTAGCGSELTLERASQSVRESTANSNAFSLFTGEITSRGQQDSIELEIRMEDFTMPDTGSVLLGFLLSAEDGSALDPGLVEVTPRSRSQAQAGGPRGPNIAGSLASLSLAEVSAGTYGMIAQGEHGTTGSYRLELSLAGDANADYQVDQADIDLIDGLRGVKRGEPDYLSLADVDRNGVINGGDLQRAIRNLGASTSLRIEVPNPLDQFLNPGALSLAGVSPSAFNPRSAPLQFVLSGSEFFHSPSDVRLTINGNPVPAASLTVEAHVITASSVLLEGRNKISFSAVDVEGRPLYLDTIIWAGSRTVRVNLVGPDGSPFTGETNVHASLSDDPSVFFDTSTATGTVLVPALPNRTILFQANSGDNHYGVVGGLGGQGALVIRMLGFDAPSQLDNNDFSQGTAGWNLAGPVQIIPHVEGVPHLSGALAPGEYEAVLAERGEPPHPVAIQPPAPPPTSDPTGSTGSIVDDDLVLRTLGEGEQSISRTFTTDPGTTAVRVRFRFITTEVPGGFFGSQFNDYFSVSLRSQRGGGRANEFNSMNGLGLAAFDFASGATGWRDVILRTDVEGDTIQVNVAVANVADGLFDSQVVIDFVEEIRDQVVPSLAWNDRDGGMDLTFRVERGALTDDTTINVHWANGAGHANRIGAAIFSHVVPAGTAEGQHGPIHIGGDLLANDPAGVTHLIATSSPANVGALRDVRVNFGPNANPGVVAAAMIDIIKDGLRAAGQAAAAITSTARTPADQARAMFQNLTQQGRTIQANTQVQLALYSAPGDAVIGVFETFARSLNFDRQAILNDAATIRAALEAEINNQGPSNVSRHTADPNVISVVDVNASVFNARNGPLFVGAVRGRVTRFIDERGSNNCFHLELGLR